MRCDLKIVKIMICLKPNKKLAKKQTKEEISTLFTISRDRRQLVFIG
jgi:hypothetical protein